MANRFEKAKEYTQKYKNALVPCKFCKGTDLRITSDRTIFNPRNVWSVDCICGNCVYGLDRVKDAVRRWNETNIEENTNGSNKRSEAHQGPSPAPVSG